MSSRISGGSSTRRDRAEVVARVLRNPRGPRRFPIRSGLRSSSKFPRIVSAISLVRPLSEYNATYSNGTRVFASIHPLTNGSGNADLSFFDVDGNGNLNVGDEFHVTSPYRGDAVLRVWYLPGSAIVGYWPPSP